MGIVGGELRVELGSLLQHQPRAGEIGDIGIRLAREDRVARQAALLRALDLAVPVGALDQAHVQDALRLARKADQVTQHGGRALLVGLHRDAEARPAGQPRIAADRLEQLECQLEALGFLGVEGQRDARVACRNAQFGEARREVPDDAPAMRPVEARVHRGELHRNTRARLEVGVLADAGAQRADGRAVGLEVTVGIRAGECGFA